MYTYAYNSYIPIHIINVYMCITGGGVGGKGKEQGGRARARGGGGKEEAEGCRQGEGVGKQLRLDKLQVCVFECVCVIVCMYLVCVCVLSEGILHRATNAARSCGTTNGSRNDNWIQRTTGSSCRCAFPRCICSTMENAFPHVCVSMNVYVSVSVYARSVCCACVRACDRACACVGVLA